MIIGSGFKFKLSLARSRGWPTPRAAGLGPAAAPGGAALHLSSLAAGRRPQLGSVAQPEWCPTMARAGIRLRVRAARNSSMRSESAGQHRLGRTKPLSLVSER